MANPLTGRKAAVYVSTSAPAAFGPELGTWNTARTSVTFTNTFWLDNDSYPVTVMPNGVLTGASVTGAAGNKVQVAAGTCYLNGVSTTVTATSVTALACATSTGKQIVYAIVISTAGAYTKITGISGVASTTFGTAGGPPYITTGSIPVAYVVRATGASTTIASSMISVTSYNGQERALNPGHVEVRPVKGQIDYAEALPAVHTGGVAKRVYVSGYKWGNSVAKVATLTDWKLDIKREREDKTTQNSAAMESDPGRRTYTLSFNRFITEVADDFFDQVNDTDQDFLVKLYPNQYSTSDYYACNCGFDLSHDFPMSGKVKQAVTAQVSGRVEKI